MKVDISSGRNLFMNVKTFSPMSYVRVQVESPHGEPCEGFSFDDSPIFRGDEVDLKVQWGVMMWEHFIGTPKSAPRGLGKIPEDCSGKDRKNALLRFRIELQSAKLFSFQVRSE